MKAYIWAAYNTPLSSPGVPAAYGDCLECRGNRQFVLAPMNNYPDDAAAAAAGLQIGDGYWRGNVTTYWTKGTWGWVIGTADNGYCAQPGGLATRLA